MFATENRASAQATSTKINDIASVGNTLTDAEIQLVSGGGGGGGETSTADNNTCDTDGTPSRRPGSSLFSFSLDLLVEHDRTGA